MERNRFRSFSSSTLVKGKALKRAGWAMLAVLAAGLFSAPAVHAALTYSGSLSPVNPSTWTSSTNAYVGQTANGSLTVDGGSTV